MLKNIGSKKPTRMWIDGKCFNIPLIKRKSKRETKDNEHESEEETYNEQIDITTNENGQLTTSFHLPNFYYKKLPSFKNFDVKALTNETDTEIYIPKMGEKGNIIITGKNEDNIKEALRELHTIIGQIREQNMALQFISIPLNNDQIKSSFEDFKSSVLKLEGVRGLDESIFQKSTKLHLTVIVLSLLNDREINEAVSALQSYKTSLEFPKNVELQQLWKRNLNIPMSENVNNSVVCSLHFNPKDYVQFRTSKKRYLKKGSIPMSTLMGVSKSSNLISKHGPLKIHVSGLDCMNQDYKKVHVLYANAKIVHDDPEVNLQKIANDISEYFYEKGLVKSYTESVKLHMTLMNTKYRRSREENARRRWSKRENFDASQILEKYKNFEFGECSFDTVNLSLISTTDENGFYKSISTIKL